MKKLKSIITLQDLVDFAAEHNLPTTIPIGIALCDSERGDACRGIVVEIAMDEDELELGECEYEPHCYFKGDSPLEYIENGEQMLMLTDGYHYE